MQTTFPCDNARFDSCICPILFLLSVTYAVIEEWPRHIDKCKYMVEACPKKEEKACTCQDRGGLNYQTYCPLPHTCMLEKKCISHALCLLKRTRMQVIFLTARDPNGTHTHTHTHNFIPLYIWIPYCLEVHRRTKIPSKQLIHLMSQHLRQHLLEKLFFLWLPCTSTVLDQILTNKKSLK